MGGGTQVPYHPGAPRSPGVCGEELGIVTGRRGGVCRCERGHGLRFSRAAFRLARRLVGTLHVVNNVPTSREGIKSFYFCFKVQRNYGLQVVAVVDGRRKAAE